MIGGCTAEGTRVALFVFLALCLVECVAVALWRGIRR